MKQMQFTDDPMGSVVKSRHPRFTLERRAHFCEEHDTVHPPRSWFVCVRDADCVLAVAVTGDVEVGLRMVDAIANVTDWSRPVPELLADEPLRIVVSLVCNLMSAGQGVIVLGAVPPQPPQPEPGK